MRTGFFIALMLFILASLFPTQLLGLFTTDQTIIEAGLSYLAIIRFTYFFFAVTQILLATLRCVEIAGVALISTWGIVIPLSMFMAFVVKASPAVVVCCLNADQIFKCVPAFLKCNYGHWIKNMTN